MDVMHSCLCCLRCPPEKYLTSPYTHLDKTEIYSNMFKECFNIEMVLDGWGLCGICSTCVGRLRDASDFKQQVQRCQAELQGQANSRVKGEELDIRQDYIFDDDEKPDIQMEYVDGDPGSSSGSAHVLCEELDIQQDYVDDGDEKPDIQPEHVDGDPRRDSGSAHVLQESSVKLAPATNETELLDEERSVKPEMSDDAASVEDGPTLASPVCGSAESSVLLRARQQLAAACAVRLERLRELLYSCDECGKGFRIKSVLRKHIQRSHIVTDLLYSSHGSLYKSPKCHTLMLKTIKCADKTNKSNLKMHQSSMHTGEKLLQCDCCDYKCSKKFNLRTHLRIHTGEKPFKCGYCDYKCSDKSSFHRHQRRHTGEKPFKCGCCGYEFSDKSSFHRHQRLHTGEKPFKCGYCDYKCSDKSNLLRHQRTHTGEKQFKCDHCDFKCSVKSSSLRHQRTHTGEKPFKCGYCDYKSNDISNVRTHLRIHTGEKPFECGYCDYKCIQKSHLISHQRIHTGEKRFKCGYCDYKSSNKSHLITHQRIHRKEAV